MFCFLDITAVYLVLEDYHQTITSLLYATTTWFPMLPPIVWNCFLFKTFTSMKWRTKCSHLVMCTTTTFPSIINTSQNPRWLEWFRDLHVTIVTCVRSHSEVTRTNHVASCSYGKSPYPSIFIIEMAHVFFGYLQVKLPEASLGKWETHTKLHQSPSGPDSWWGNGHENEGKSLHAM